MGDWSVPDDIYEDRAFKLDKLMQALPANSEFGKGLSQGQLLQLGRRTLEVAIRGAIGNGLDLSAKRLDWQEAHRLATNAYGHLDLFLNNLTGQSEFENHFALVPPLRSLTPLGAKSSAEREDAIRRQSKSLTDARQALKTFIEGAAERDQYLASINKNEGARDKNEFVRTFSEIWAAVTGTLPPTSRNTNLFLNLLDEAWEDAGQNRGANFTRSIARASADIECNLPRLSAMGPEWLILGADPHPRFAGVCNR